LYQPARLPAPICTSHGQTSPGPRWIVTACVNDSLHAEISSSPGSAHVRSSALARTEGRPDLSTHTSTSSAAAATGIIRSAQTPNNTDADPPMADQTIGTTAAMRGNV